MAHVAGKILFAAKLFSLDMQGVGANLPQQRYLIAVDLSSCFRCQPDTGTHHIAHAQFAAAKDASQESYAGNDIPGRGTTFQAPDVPG